MNKQRLLPDAIIAGAPKCGTTSLFDWLSSHPDVCPSNIKETRFLLDKNYPLFCFQWNYHKNGLQGYNKFFLDCHGSCKLKIEATPDYIYQKTALEVIAALPNEPKVLFVLRNPSERVYSLYQFARNNMSTLPKRITFKRMVDAAMEGNDDKCLDGMPLLKNAISHSRYVDYIERWVKKLGTEKIKIIIFEDMKKNPGKVIAEVSDFLGISPDFYTQFDFEVKNKTYVVRNQSLNRFKRWISNYLPRGRWRKPLVFFYKRINMEKKKQKNMEELEVMNKLNDYFEPYNLRLSEAFDLDIKLWKQ